MADDKKPKAIINIPSFDKSKPSRSERPLARPRPMRTEEELRPIAERATGNAELMRQFSEVIGSEDGERARAVIDEIERFARSLDPTVTRVDAVTITALLMKMAGHPGDCSK